MPGFDQTGPENKGPVTGRGLGRCARKDTAEEPRAFGGGRGRRRGCGRGRGGQGGRSGDAGGFRD